jgi:hypothetical protein
MSIPLIILIFIFGMQVVLEFMEIIGLLMF